VILLSCIDTLKELTQYTAVSGREYEFSAILKEKFSATCDSVEIDKFYNVIALKKGMGNNAPRIMILAHLDEISFLVKSIDENGFIKFTNVGGIDARILLSHEVVIHGKKDILGVIGAKPPHLLDSDEIKKAVKIDELSIDTGMNAEELKKYVSIGDAITLKSYPFILQDNKYSSKSVDNRCGVSVLFETANELNKFRHESDVYFVATVQEELNLAGAKMTAFNIEPDIAIVVDACHGDVPDAPKDVIFPLGKGPAIGMGPILSRELTDKMIDTAKENNIPYQVDVEPDSTGTDAWATQVSKYGIPTALVSIPVRYMHTSIETVHANDIKHAGELIARFIAERV